MDAERLADGLWRWRADGVTCLYYEAGDATVLVDPVVPGVEESEFLRHLDADVERRGLPVLIFLTGTSRHSADELAARYGGRVLSAAG